ncbi:Uncharacterized MFS-type transporter [hydrothermal vent metagenome]|uniref:Uncharacterized MFS-type transporter n=1 Tax=hydrothermal vent metagenome TaxID=652676 RepID=A0A3B0TZZ0_9ZZZZ
MSQSKTSKKGIFSWMLFDWAAQPFHTLLVTFIFAPYFVAKVAENSVDGQALWGQAMGIGGIFIALMAPFLGALADATGPRKPWIAVFSLTVIAGTALLWLATPDGNAPVNLILLAFVLALVGIEFSTVFTNSMMPSLVPRSELGKLSGSGWALGYIGGIIALIMVLGFMAASPTSGKTLFGLTPVLGLDPGQYEGERASGPLTAIWYLVFIIPMFLFTPDLPKLAGKTRAVRTALSNLWATVSKLPERKSYFSFLITSMLYRDGLNGLYMFGGIYAAGVLGMSTTQIGIFGILAAVAGTAGAFFGGRMDAKLGPKTVVFWSCWLLVIAGTVIVSSTPESILFVVPVTSASTPLIVFYIAGSLIGAAGGSLQAASRTLLVDQVGRDETTEAFGLYALAGRATSFIAPLSIAFVTTATQSQRIGITPVIVLLAIGAIGLFWVREKQPQ